MLETAHDEGLRGAEGFDPSGDFDDWRAMWPPVTISLNEMARSMGTPDPYPFAPSPTAVRKMAFVVEVIRGSR
jgi:hypothetical protein